MFTLMCVALVIFVTTTVILNLEFVLFFGVGKIIWIVCSFIIIPIFSANVYHLKVSPFAMLKVLWEVDTIGFVTFFILAFLWRIYFIELGGFGYNRGLLFPWILFSLTTVLYITHFWIVLQCCKWNPTRTFILQLILFLYAAACIMIVVL